MTRKKKPKFIKRNLSRPVKYYVPVPAIIRMRYKARLLLNDKSKKTIPLNHGEIREVYIFGNPVDKITYKRLLGKAKAQSYKKTRFTTRVLIIPVDFSARYYNVREKTKLENIRGKKYYVRRLNPEKGEKKGRIIDKIPYETAPDLDTQYYKLTGDY